MNDQPASTRSSTVRWIVVVVTLLMVLVGGLSLTALLQGCRRDAPSREPTQPLPSAQTVAPAPKPEKLQAHSIPAPRSKRSLQTFDYGWFTVGYDNERRAGAWGRYELDGPITFKGSQPARPAFRTEERSSARVTTKDYLNPENHFERGHIVPSYAMWSRFGDEARRATFVMTNVFPQDENLNGRIWEDIEDDIAGQAKAGVVSDEGYAGRLRHITVIAGPVYYETTRHLPSGIPIPDACFHVIYDLDENSGTYRARAYLFPNQSNLAGPASKYAISIRGIEAATGLDFMPDGGAEAERIEAALSAVEKW